MTLLYSGLAAPLKGKLLNCLPGIRWAPSDLPPHAAATDKEKKPHRAYSLFAHAKRPADSNTNLGPVYRRRSVVSVDEIPDDEIERRLKAQDQSRFFAMLPVEVRGMVYAYVFGADTLHLTMGTKRRFGHFVCEGPERHGEGEGECGCRVLVGGREGRRVQGGEVLRVCRRMYSEAVPHLYTPHTFSLLHLTHLLYLPTRLPLPRINTIRTLRLRWGIRALPYLRRGPSKRLAYPEDTSNWARAWAILAGMQGLRDLYVVLVDPSRDMMWERNWKELEGFLLEPVKEVVRPWRFELVLPYASCEVGWDMGESPVRLRRPRPGPGEDED